jgi:hypothetical protein
MHRLLREKLDAASGNSEFVIAMNLDIRGFSDWSLKVDSAQTALYLKKVYAKLIDTYFTSASFIKPTGDGLLVIEAIEESQLTEALLRTITNSMEIIEQFGSLCSDEPMINFSVPEDVGIGLARGSASRLATEDLTLDYSGNVLNLASRLMDLARPNGLIVDGGFGLSLLPEDLGKKFFQKDVYLKGVSPNTPTSVDCWPSSIQIPAMHLKPLEEEEWDHANLDTNRQQLESSTSTNFRFDLEASPLPGTKVECEVTHAAVTAGGRKATNRQTFFPISVELDEVAGKPIARIDQKALAARLKTKGVGPSWDVGIKLSYRVA